jgi:hypothetical protein
LWLVRGKLKENWAGILLKSTLSGPLRLEWFATWL